MCWAWQGRLLVKTNKAVGATLKASRLWALPGLGLEGAGSPQRGAELLPSLLPLGLED